MRIEKQPYSILLTTKHTAFVLVILISSCINVAASAQSVGDIAFDPKTDDPKFQLCNNNWVWQGYELKTKMDETALTVDRDFRSKFKSQPQWSEQNAIVRVRFIVNCHGIADRFRILPLDFNLKPVEMDDALRTHILTIAKEIQWPTRRAQSQTVDYYHYFSIRITKGNLTDVIQ
jgi:hypothetical protein